MASSEENQEASYPHDADGAPDTFIVAPDGKQIEVRAADVAVAFHEAGHAVAAIACGLAISNITLSPGYVDVKGGNDAPLTLFAAFCMAGHASTDVFLPHLRIEPSTGEAILKAVIARYDPSVGNEDDDFRVVAIRLEREFPEISDLEMAERLWAHYQASRKIITANAEMVERVTFALLTSDKAAIASLITSSFDVARSSPPPEVRPAPLN